MPFIGLKGLHFFCLENKIRTKKEEEEKQKIRSYIVVIYAALAVAHVERTAVMALMFDILSHSGKKG